METSVLTVLFTDLVGSVKMYSRVTDSVAVDLVQDLDRQVREILPRFRGKFIKSTGDGHLLTFEDAPAGVRAAAEIHRLCDQTARKRNQDVFVRIAMHAGEVFHAEGDIHGNTVNLTARLLSVVGACETGVTSEAWGTIGEAERAGFIPHGPEVFKGFTRYTYVYKRPNPNPIMDMTVRQQSMAGDEIRLDSIEGMPRHPEYVLALTHPQASKTIAIKEGETHVLGRAPECGTVIPDRMFSGTHAAFAVVDGRLWAFDLQSANGFSYRGRRVKGRKPIEANSVLQLPQGTLDVKLP